MSMNKIQLTYALKRLDEALQDKLNAVRDKHPDKTKPLTIGMVIDGIKNGKVKVSRDLSDHYVGYTSLNNVFDVSAVRPKKVPEADNIARSKAISKDQEPIHAEYRRIKDKLILGDASDALKLIEAFAAKKF